MQEAVAAFIVLLVGVVVGTMLKPTEAMLAPLFPDDIKGSFPAHAEADHHHDHHHH
jgi:hypothetical protein